MQGEVLKRVLAKLGGKAKQLGEAALPKVQAAGQAAGAKIGELSKKYPKSAVAASAAGGGLVGAGLDALTGEDEEEEMDLSDMELEDLIKLLQERGAM